MSSFAEDEAAADALLAREPRSLAGLLRKGDCRFEAGDERAATAFYQAALRESRRQGSGPELADGLRRAEVRVARSGGNFRRHLEDWLAAKHLGPEAVGPRFAEALAILFGEKQARLTLQQPSIFYLPGLPQRRFYEPEEFAWLPRLVAAAGAIREELSAVLTDGEGLKPYVETERDRPHHHFHGLHDDPSWSAFYLIEDGKLNRANAIRCPDTMAALAGVPLCDMPGRTPNVHFALLGAGTRIPPHVGMLNTRLICHLPLIVPAGCGLCIGGEVRHWHEPLIFDDSIVHEAWNDSGELRAVLLFDIWRPELSDVERRAVAALFEAIDAYRPG